jgi:hypothetical protein
LILVPPQGRRRRQRTVFTQNNVQQLDSVFVHNQYPDIELRETLAAQMGVPESRIQVCETMDLAEHVYVKTNDRLSLGLV